MATGEGSQDKSSAQNPRGGDWSRDHEGVPYLLAFSVCEPAFFYNPGLATHGGGTTHGGLALLHQ